MLKLYKEDEEFDAYTSFDTESGRLSTLSPSEFQAALPAPAAIPTGPLVRIRHDGRTIFLGETHPTHVRFPRRIYMQITRHCNLRCEYCFIKAGVGRPHVPTDAVLAFAEFAAEQGLMEVRLTGGEPTRHPDFITIMRAFQRRGVYVSLATNGLWDAATQEALRTQKHLWVIVSIDGKESTHNRYRPNTFRSILANLRTLKEHNPSVRIRLTTVLTKYNINEMYDLGRIATSVAAESVTVIPLRPQVREPAIRTEMVTGSEFKGVIEDLLRAKADFGVNFTTTMETDYKDAIYRDPIVRKRSSCAAGREATNLDYDADTGRFQVYGCSYSPASDLQAPQKIRRPFLAGTFSPTAPGEFLEIWRDSERWRIYRDLSIRSEKCLSCRYLANHQCTGSCPIQNLDLSKIDLAKDVLAQLALQIRRTGEWYCYQTLEGPNSP